MKMFQKQLAWIKGLLYSFRGIALLGTKQNRILAWISQVCQNIYTLIFNNYIIFNHHPFNPIWVEFRSLSWFRCSALDFAQEPSSDRDPKLPLFISCEFGEVESNIHNLLMRVSIYTLGSLRPSVLYSREDRMLVSYFLQIISSDVVYILLVS
jgi:hypothetical protein